MARGGDAPRGRETQIIRGTGRQHGAAVLQVAGHRLPRLRMQGHFEGLAALGPAEPDDRAIEIDIPDAQEPHARVARCGGLQDREDGLITPLKGPLPRTAALDGLQVG